MNVPKPFHSKPGKFLNFHLRALGRKEAASDERVQCEPEAWQGRGKRESLFENF